MSRANNRFDPFPTEATMQAEITLLLSLCESIASRRDRISQIVGE